MRIIIVVFSFFIATVTFAQLSSRTKDSLDNRFINTPYNLKSDYKTWTIKATCLPVFIGNSGLISNVLGMEYGFMKNQSISIDLNYIYSEDSHDMVADTAGVSHNTGNYSYSNEEAVFAYYRYYFSWQKIRESKGLSFYSSCYFRYGYVERKEDPAFSGNYISQKESNYAEGILFGAIKQCNYKRLGLDFNVGVFDKQKDIATIYSADTRHQGSSNIGVKIGFTLDYLIFVKN
jgi:hypothetical protein